MEIYEDWMNCSRITETGDNPIRPHFDTKPCGSRLIPDYHKADIFLDLNFETICQTIQLLLQNTYCSLPCRRVSVAR